MEQEESFHDVKEVRSHHKQPQEALGTQHTDILLGAETSNLIK